MESREIAKEEMELAFLERCVTVAICLVFLAVTLTASMVSFFGD